MALSRDIYFWHSSSHFHRGTTSHSFRHIIGLTIRCRICWIGIPWSEKEGLSTGGGEFIHFFHSAPLRKRSSRSYLSWSLPYPRSRSYSLHEYCNLAYLFAPSNPYSLSRYGASFFGMAWLVSQFSSSPPNHPIVLSIRLGRDWLLGIVFLSHPSPLV